MIDPESVLAAFAKTPFMLGDELSEHSDDAEVLKTDAHHRIRLRSEHKSFFGALGKGELRHWEEEERAALALLLLLMMYGEETRSQTIRQERLWLAEETLARMLARDFFRTLSPADARLLMVATEHLDPGVRRRLPELHVESRIEKAPPRAVGPIALPDAYRRQLFWLRAALRPDAEPVVSLADVKEAERSLRLRLPDKLLGLLAVTGANPKVLAALTSDLREEHGARGGLRSAVAIGYETNDLFGIGMSICASCNRSGSADYVFAWNWHDGDARESGYRAGAPYDGSDFATFLRWRWGRWQLLERGRPPLDMATPNVDLDAPVDAQLFASFVPRLVEESRRRVKHPKFGEGAVLSASEDGSKLRIQFASGERTLLASVVVPA